jgi:succinate dehydrogenase / fumarate reductase membrane anchor subunit
MVTKLYKLKKTGIFDYVLVRVTAVIQAVYFSVITFYWLVNKDFNYEQLSSFFDILFIEIFTIIVAFSIAYHSIQGIWNVATDYLTQAQIGASAKVLRPMVVGFSWLQALGLIICSLFILG